MRALLAVLLIALAAPGAAAAEKMWRVGLLSMGYNRPPSGATTTWRGELLETLRIGEGSHQLTAQEIGQFYRFGLKPIIFVSQQ